MWDEDNLQPLCHGCHSRKTALRDGGFGRGREGRVESSEVERRGALAAASSFFGVKQRIAPDGR